MDPQLELKIFGEVVLAAFLGGLIGFEREFAGKPAGLRTHMLVAASAAFLVALGNYIVLTFEFPSYVSTDPVRIIHAIIVGISFLGAGTILRRRGENQVEGLTTSASILAGAAVGISTAIGLIYLAIGVTAIILFINQVLGPIEGWLESRASKADPEERRGDASRQETAHRVAWSAVKNEYEKQGDDWARKESQ